MTKSVNCSINDRVRQIAHDVFKDDITAMAKASYISRSTIYSIIGEKEVKPGYDIIRRFAEMSTPEINIEWLITGEGEMLLSKVPQAAITVLLLPVSAQGGSLNDFVLSVREDDCEKVVSPVRGVDFAMQVTGDSMAPEYPNGSRIFIKRINEKAFIEWGKTYVLDTCNGSVIKRIVPSENKGFIKCVSINTDPIYAPFEVSMSDIYGIYKVLLCMSVK